MGKYEKRQVRKETKLNPVNKTDRILEIFWLVL